MANQDFTTTLRVSQTPKQVYDAINHPENWWPGEITGSSDNLNDEFTYRYKELHVSTQRIIEMIPDQKVVWLVTGSTINYAEDKNEWTGTQISFEISEADKKTELKFSHLGLNPEIECFDSCSNSWSRIIQQSLMALITRGKGEDLFLG